MIADFGACASVLVVCASLLAQGYTAGLVGTVSDPSGLSVFGAKIAVVHNATGRELAAFSGERGDFAINGLVPGTYVVRVEAPGFQTLVRTGVIAEVAQTVRVDMRLAIGESIESVTVTAAAGLIDTESGARGQVVTTRETESIPLNGRNFLLLAQLAPGVLPAAAGQNPHNVNGARSDHVSYLLDGLTNMRRRGHEPSVLPSLEAAQEFRIMTNSFAAEYGRMPAAVSLALKSGGNTLFGSIFEFLRNDALDARGFFDQETPKLKRNQFGAMLGGPLRRNRTFFLGSYEGLRSRAEESRLSRVPSAAERAGQFASPIRDPLTAIAFPGNLLPAGRIDPVAMRLLAFVPLPNRFGAVNFITMGTLANDTDVFTGKLDHRFTGKHHFSARAVLDFHRGGNPFRGTNLPGFGSTARTRNQHWGATYTAIISPAQTNEARAGFNRSTFLETSVNAGKDTAREAGISGVAPGSGLTNIVIAGYTSFGDVAALPSDWTDNTWFASDTFSWVRGRHLLKLGGEIQRAQYFELFGAFTMGQLAFATAGSGHPFADFLLGYPQQAQRQVGTNKAYMFSTIAGAFLQDDWRLHPRLSLNLGLRYDISLPPVEKYNRWANFLPELGRSIVAGEPGFPRSLLRTDWVSVSPRLGLAWRMDGQGLSVLRIGYGIFFDFDSQFQTYQALGATAHPFTRLELLQTSARDRLRLADPFASAAAINPAALSPNGVAYHNTSPYTQNWNVTIARQLSSNTGVEIAYVGAKATHQSAALNVNQTIRTPQGNISPYPGFSRIIVFTPGVNSNYHAFQGSVRRRIGAGLSFRSAFTWSKAIDYLSFGSAARQPQNARDLAAERGLADFNRTCAWSSDAVYELPFGRGRRFAANWNTPLNLLFGGWQLASIVHAYSGRPFTPTQTGNNQAGEPTRPDRLGSGESESPSIDRWFAVEAFRRVAANEFHYGNSGRNILTGPGKLIFDASIGKEFVLDAERQRLIFRAEFFNLLNRANFGDPAAAIDQPTAGVISSADPGRQVQFGLKYVF
jgi:hypothetical protein